MNPKIDSARSLLPRSTLSSFWIYNAQLAPERSEALQYLLLARVPAVLSSRHSDAHFDDTDGAVQQYVSISPFKSSAVRETECFEIAGPRGIWNSLIT